MQRFLFFPLFFLSTVVFSQKQMDLDACLRYAVEHSYKTTRATIELDNNKKDYTGAILAHLPSISGSVGASAGFGRGLDPATNTYVTTSSFVNSVGLHAGIPIFGGLRYLNQTRSAKIAKLRGEELLRQTHDKVAEETMLVFAEVVYYTELLELGKKQIENYQMEEKRGGRLLEFGGGSSADLAQIRATLSSMEYEAIAIRNNLEISVVKLKDCMNYPLDENLVVVPQIPEIDLYLEGQTSNEVIAFAFDVHPTVVIGREDLEIQKRSLSIARGSYYPYISLSGGISTDFFTSGNYKDPLFTQYKDNFGQGVGLYVSVPIFSGLETRLRVSKAKNNLKQAQCDYDETMRTLSSEIRQAMLELEASKSQWEQAKKNVEYHQIANQANKRRYENGIISIIELQTSDNQLFQSEIELRNVYLRYQIKVREMNYYKGVPYVRP